MSDAYSIDDLKVNPFQLTPKKKVAKARFRCPICNEFIEMIFTEEDIKQLLKGIRN